MRDLAVGFDYLWDPIANWPALTGDGQDVLRREIHRKQKEEKKTLGHTHTKSPTSLLTDTQLLYL